MQTEIQTRKSEIFIEGTRDEILVRKIDPTDPNSPIFAHLEVIKCIASQVDVPEDVIEATTSAEQRKYSLFSIKERLNFYNSNKDYYKKEQWMETAYHLIACSFGNMENLDSNDGDYQKRRNNLRFNIADQSLGLLETVPSK